MQTSNIFVSRRSLPMNKFCVCFTNKPSGWSPLARCQMSHWCVFPWVASNFMFVLFPLRMSNQNLKIPRKTHFVRRFRWLFSRLFWRGFIESFGSMFRLQSTEKLRKGTYVVVDTPESLSKLSARASAHNRVRLRSMEGKCEWWKSITTPGEQWTKRRGKCRKRIVVVREKIALNDVMTVWQFVWL